MLLSNHLLLNSSSHMQRFVTQQLVTHAMTCYYMQPTCHTHGNWLLNSSSPTICYSTACRTTICYSTACCSTACHTTVCYSAAYHTTICYSTACHTLVTHATICYSTACHICNDLLLDSLSGTQPISTQQLITHTVNGYSTAGATKVARAEVIQTRSGVGGTGKVSGGRCRVDMWAGTSLQVCTHHGAAHIHGLSHNKLLCKASVCHTMVCHTAIYTTAWLRCIHVVSDARRKQVVSSIFTYCHEMPVVMLLRLTTSVWRGAQPFCPRSRFAQAIAGGIAGHVVARGRTCR